MSSNLVALLWGEGNKHWGQLQGMGHGAWPRVLCIACLLPIRPSPFLFSQCHEVCSFESTMTFGPIVMEQSSCRWKLLRPRIKISLYSFKLFRSSILSRHEKLLTHQVCTSPEFDTQHCKRKRIRKKKGIGGREGRKEKEWIFQTAKVAVTILHSHQQRLKWEYMLLCIFASIFYCLCYRLSLSMLWYHY